MWKYGRIIIAVAFSIMFTLIMSAIHIDAMRATSFGRFINQLFTPSQQVTITALPAWGSMPVMDFTVTEAEGIVTCEWVNSPTGVATMIRAKYGSPVLSETDGYLVYYGPAETCEDLGVYTDDKISVIHYTAYSVNGVGVYSDPVSAILEVSMLALILVTCALIALAFWQRNAFLYLIVGMVCIGFGVYWIGENNGFIYVMEGVAGIALGFYMIIDVARAHLRRE